MDKAVPNQSRLICQGAIDPPQLPARLREIVGRRHVMTDPGRTLRFRTGFRFGSGPALAVVRPGSLVEMWRVLHACASANTIVLMQAANTGLTGGSTPDGRDYDRNVVIINTLRLAKIHLIEEGHQVVCLPGATLHQLESALKPLGRDPHSVIGSSCIGASVFGGVCNNSGGSLIHRGPVFTQLTLYAQIDAQGEIHLVNHLGIRLGNDPETILSNVEHGNFGPVDIEHDSERRGSDSTYIQHVRDIEAETPARFNADPKRLFEASGSAGKVMVFAVRLDTFPHPAKTVDFYVGTNDPAELTTIRRHMLATFKELPIAAEYIHRDAFNIAEVYGKDTFLAIRHLGTDRLPQFFTWKSRYDIFASRFNYLPRNLSDRTLQAFSRLFPRHLPKRMYDYRDRFEHHLIMKMADTGVDEARDYLKSVFPSAKGDYFECTLDEGEKAFLHRYAVAGAAIRYRAIHWRQVEDIVALDIALPRNEQNWVEHLPEAVSAPILHKLYYAHFFCLVFHQDYIVKKGHDTLALEHRMWKLLDERNAEYPAEHNVGHLYNAKPVLENHYRSLDPCNVFNPGIGHTSKCLHWT
jgi:D-lactate dehydrogenase (quinone)